MLLLSTVAPAVEWQVDSNARVLATLCNLPDVREVLSNERIEIPEEKVFAAAEHKTTVDELSLAAQEAFDRIEAIMPKAIHNANAERLVQLPNF